MPADRALAPIPGAASRSATSILIVARSRDTRLRWGGGDGTATGGTETIVVDNNDAVRAPDDGTTLSIDNDGAAMDVNQPGVDANVDTDGEVDAKVQMKSFSLADKQRRRE